MPAATRTIPTLAGKEIIVLIKKPGGTDYVPFGCMTSADYDSPGAELEDVSCRSGTLKSPGGDIPPPVVSVEHLIRVYPTGDVATNISDEEIADWVENATPLDFKYSKGDKAGDVVKTGQVILNGYSAKGPQKGNATGSFKANFLAMPVKSKLS